jgi:SAM-dependent methyltransferase
LFCRHANNSFLAAIPLLLLLKELQSQPSGLTVLDLNCGVGHASFLMRTLFPSISVIATDHDFVNLYLARRHMVPDTCCICLDAELPLPFGDRFLDAVLCLDGLHYVRSKRALLKELDRSVKEAGIWLFPHMHNALASNISSGVPLKPSDYQRCFDFLPSRLCIESEIFQTFMRNQTLNLAESRSPEQLDCAPVLSLVASRIPDIWRTHDRLAERLQTRSNLRINPIYHRNGGDRGGVHLRMAWPNITLERECEPVKEFLPRECDIDPSLWARLQSGALRDEDEPELKALIQSFVLVPLPDNYA